MKNVLGIHVETTGLDAEQDDIVAIALCSCDDNFEIKNTRLVYRKGLNTKKLENAYAYNKLSIQFLDDNGVEEEEFIEEVLSFIVEELDITSPIKLLGYNTSTFVKPFLVSMLEKHDINLSLSCNTLDVYSLVAIFFEDTNINSLIELSCKDAEFVKEEKVLLKCITFVNIFKKVTRLWNKKVLKNG